MKKMITVLLIALLCAGTAGLHAQNGVVIFPAGYTAASPLQLTACTSLRGDDVYIEPGLLNHNLSLTFHHFGVNITAGNMILEYVYDLYSYDCPAATTPALVWSNISESVVVKTSSPQPAAPLVSLVNLHTLPMRQTLVTGLYEIRFKSIRLRQAGISSGLVYTFFYNSGGSNILVDNNAGGGSNGCMPNYQNIPGGCDWYEFAAGSQPVIFFKYIQTARYAISETPSRLCVNQLPPQMGARCTACNYDWRFFRIVNGLQEIKFASGPCAAKPCGQWSYEVRIRSVCFDCATPAGNCTDGNGVSACEQRLWGSSSVPCYDPAERAAGTADTSGQINVPKKMVITPNPAHNGTVTVKVPAGLRPLTLRVTGNRFNSRFLGQFHGRNEIHMNTTGWPSGIYTCTVTLHDGSVISSSLLVN